MRLSSRALSQCVVVCLVGLASVPAYPTEPTREQLAEARDAFQKARRLEDQGQWSDALELLQRVGEVKMTPQVRFHIALCMENVGVLTQALEGFQIAVREGTPGAAQVVKESRDHIRDLEKRIPTVTVTAAGATATDQLMLDGRAIPLGDPPLPVRLDPGPHKAEVRRGQAVVARELFVLEAQVTRRIELRVGSVTPDPSAPEPPPTATAAPTTPPPLPAPSAPADRPTNNVQRLLGWTALGVGVASAIATGVFIGLRASKLDQLQQKCPALAHCTPDATPIISDGKTYAALVNVFAAVGVVGIVGGIVLLETAPPSRRPAPSAGNQQAWSASMRATPTGLRLEGTF